MDSEGLLENILSIWRFGNGDSHSGASRVPFCTRSAMTSPLRAPETLLTCISGSGRYNRVLSVRCGCPGGSDAPLLHEAMKQPEKPQSARADDGLIGGRAPYSRLHRMHWSGPSANSVHPNPLLHSISSDKPTTQGRSRASVPGTSATTATCAPVPSLSGRIIMGTPHPHLLRTATGTLSHRWRHLSNALSFPVTVRRRVDQSFGCSACLADSV